MITTDTFKKGIESLDQHRKINNRYTKYDLSTMDVEVREFSTILLNLITKREIEITEEDLDMTYEIMTESYREFSTINSNLPKKEEFITYITNLVF